MSYASVLAENAPPVEEQPKPDPNLLEGQGDHHPTEHENEKQPGDNDGDEHHSNDDRPSSGKKEDQIKQKAKRAAKEGKKPMSDPQNQVGAISLVNVITLSATALFALKYWNKPHWDKRVVSGVIVGVSAILGGQGYLVNLFSNFQKKQ
ncbi:hypothetical protein PGT21_029313 [Puccinia graminis f. sp. tritici]|uniref:Uncharacterized protein n=1 Tax=Puccinia graminis f. sp. tritici TaxID=56615 RepID=A0A5B0ME12_PUCGR|nr:hypothetical protein PGT21_029313 [Puccinia graminis f. sp. tritici]